MRKPIKISASALLLSSLGAFAQTPVTPGVANRTITGIVMDEYTVPMPGVTVTVKPYAPENVATTDIDGAFNFYRVKADTLVVESPGFKTQVVPVTNASDYTIQLEEIPEEVVVVYHPFIKRTVANSPVIPVQKRTFFGRIFHTIGNIFR